MLHFNELKITPDNKYLIIDVYVDTEVVTHEEEKNMKTQRNLYRWIILLVLGLFLMIVPSISCKAAARLNASN